jgi:hypothetical protein
VIPEQDSYGAPALTSDAPQCACVRRAIKEEGGVRCHFIVDAEPGHVKDVTLHWGVAMKSDDEWITPQKAGIQSIVPGDSVLYKDRAIRTALKAGANNKLEVSLFIPDDLTAGMPHGVRFVLFEPSSDVWYPGGAGGNFFCPCKERSGMKRPALTRSPSFTGAVDVEEITQQLQTPTKSTPPKSGPIDVGNLSHLMWNAAQRAAAWVDGKRESTGMRLQRSASFECAVKLLEAEKRAKEQSAEEADMFFKSQGGRMYTVPFAYNSDSGRKKGSVKASVIKGTVKLEILPEQGDAGPGKLLLHWGVGYDNPGDSPTLPLFIPVVSCCSLLDTRWTIAHVLVVRLRGLGSAGREDDKQTDAYIPQGNLGGNRIPSCFGGASSARARNHVCKGTAHSCLRAERFASRRLVQVWQRQLPNPDDGSGPRAHE